MRSETLALYLHFPWCVQKCPYCDFNSHPLTGTLLESEYRDAVLEDLDNELDPDTVIGSVFFGGGTPSLFSPATFERILTEVGARLASIQRKQLEKELERLSDPIYEEIRSVDQRARDRLEAHVAGMEDGKATLTAASATHYRDWPATWSARQEWRRLAAIELVNLLVVACG